MSEHIKVDRKLPPHELNARRNRKRAITKLPAVAHLPPVHHHQAQSLDDHHVGNSVNDHVYNPATNPINKA